ncbi:hydantoinase/oxoprolinase family protein [Halomicrococcus sp. SG-WS-1]|uniref:hydantoinase/oxoprolinase family protein n=1 Tax=Halomicrococcus sp. SG-WS-1 TaxID=3439057 RepID=UPI003F7946C5
MAYVTGVDTGGTFTDTVIVGDDGSRVTGKAPTTPDRPEEGVVASLANAAETLDHPLEDVLADTSVLFHGTTLTTNTVLERTGGDVGLVTTRGHRDALHIGRTTTRTKGLSQQEMQHYAAQSKPQPLVPKANVRELDERTDYAGEEVVSLDDDQVRDAVADLADDVDAIAVNLLWSFRNADHERRVGEIAADVAPDTPTYLSHEVVPKLGEYERGATTAVNAYTAPVLADYVDDLASALSDRGLDAPVYLMKSTGGAMPLTEVENDAVATINSGPAGGVIGSQFIGDAVDEPNLICTDVGGTSFDVGLVIDGDHQVRATSAVQQYSLYQLSVDIESIGSGGGSVAWIDDGGALQVGPESAGADPGPACYDLGGDRPTVTDADLVLGYLNPEYFLGGRRELDVDAARAAMQEHVADPLGVSVEEAAASVFEIVNGAMADLLRQVTVERGHDPRNFSIFAYGGAGPLHASFYGEDLGTQSTIVPLGDTASVFSAFGISTSNVGWVEEMSNPAVAPFDADDLADTFGELEDRIESDFESQGFDTDAVSYAREVDLRYKGQVHQVSVPVPTGDLADGDVDDLLERFEAKYESLYGPGSTYAEAEVELVHQRVRGSGDTTNPTLAASAEAGDARTDARDVYWPDRSAFVETAIYDGDRLTPGDAVDGPAVVQLPDTTVTVRPHQRATVDDYRNIIIE